jgi:DNA-binding NarL/FixJ family response regulator
MSISPQPAWFWGPQRPGNRPASLDRQRLLRRFWRQNPRVNPNATARHAEILRAYASGKSFRELAGEFGILEDSVRRIVARGTVAA